MSINDPAFDQFPEHDRAVSEWFARRGWTVTGRFFDFDRDIFAWRHEGQSGTRTLRITQTTIEDYPADKIIALFDHSRVADIKTNQPDSYIILRRRGAGVGFEVLDRPPEK